MKRDLDLIREILFQIERNEDPSGWIIPEIEGYLNEEVAYNINLLWQAGLIDAVNLSSGSSYSFGAKSLTWEGHEFLDAARNDGIWKRTKKFLSTKLATATFDVVKEVLIKYLRQELGV